MKKLIGITLSALLIISVICSAPFAVSAAIVDSGTTGDCTWTLDDNGNLTISGNGKMADYSEADVVWNQLPWGRFIKSVTIQDGVTYVGEYAFNSCTQLKTAVIADSVTTIRAYAFAYSGLTSITLSNVRSIQDYAFAHSKLISAELLNSTVIISDGAFYGCTDLTNITIPDSVRWIGQGAFDDTGWYANQPDGVVYVGKCVYKYKGTMPQDTSIELKDGTLAIAYKSFYKCSNLISVSFPESVKIIGFNSFQHCTSLTSIEIGKGVYEIGSYAFDTCKELTNVRIGESVKYIDSFAFSNCTKLNSITIPQSVSEIDSCAFGYYYQTTQYKKVNGFTIYGVKGSEAERYANDNRFTFIEIEPEQKLKIGDANGDNSIDVLDAAAIQKYASGKADLTPEQIAAADVNNDNNVDVLDAAEIQKFAAGKITEFKKK